MKKHISNCLQLISAVLLASLVTLLPITASITQAKAKKDRTVTGTIARKAGTAGLGKGISFGGSVDIQPASKALKRGLRALDKNDIKAALLARSALRKGTLEHKVLAWSIALYGRGVDVATLSSIATDLSNWPRTKAIRRNIENALIQKGTTSALRTAFSEATPETLSASIALGKTYLAAGEKKKARAVIAPFWRNSIVKASFEKRISSAFGRVLTRDDHRARVEYLLSRKRIRAAERVAGKAGATRLVAAAAAVLRKQGSAAKKLAAVPASQRTDPLYLLSKAQHLRQRDRFTQAAKVLMSAGANKIHANSGDRFWTEQRIVASELVALKKYKLAYKLASQNVAKRASKRIDAEFYAGWIALQKIQDRATATRHFERLLKIASTPLSKSRGYYWLGRASSKQDANKHFKTAAKYDTTYYGQLAARRLGRRSISISKASPSPSDRQRFQKYELVQAIAKLESAGHPKRARSIYRHLARNFERSGELALLAARAEMRGDFQLSLQVGKIAFRRGFNVDNLAWPVGAIPYKTKTTGAGLPLAYAISRQESTFQVDARSHANALGLMQLLPGTARAVARRVGVRYSRKKLTTSASYNARLGTAYLGEQMQRFGNSLILTFAAYNAGPSRAQAWVEKNGDPRGASLEFVVDWIEQIPYSETRNYVQRVMENLQVYKARINGDRLSVDRDLVRGNRI